MKNQPRSQIFAFGSNGAGQLGIGHRDDTSVPQTCLFVDDDIGWRVDEDRAEGDDGHRIVKIATGGNHTLVLFSSGAVYAAGNNEDGRCGVSDDDIAEKKLFKIVSLAGDSCDKRGKARSVSRFVDVAATWEASFFVDGEGIIYACGTGTKGELGLGHGITKTPLLSIDNITLDLSRCTERKEKFAGISCGVSHVVAWTMDGKVFGWGSSRKGQLGDDAKILKNIWTPTRIQIPSPPRHIVSGRDFTFVIGTDQSRLLLGDKKYFSEVHNLPSVDQDDVVAAGWSNIYTLSHSRLQTFGRNDRGQIPPQNIPSLLRIAAGSEHCVGLSTDAQVITWGWGEHGNCGQPIDINGNVAGRWNTISLKLDEDQVVQGVSAGCATSFIILGKKK